MRDSYALCYSRALRDLRDNHREEFEEHLAKHISVRDAGDLEDELDQAALYASEEAADV